MGIRLLHTSDWHLGQSFYGFNRDEEHQQFLNWLTHEINHQQIDVLLISGDVFDNSNPSSAAVRLFYRFLAQTLKNNPGLQIIATAGNHDSGSRLEAPNPLLEEFDIHIVGGIQRDTNNELITNNLIFPLKDKNNEIAAWCIAMPYLRSGDIPLTNNNSYADGVSILYQEAINKVLLNKTKNHALICMGHLHTLNAETSNDDKYERQIMGGIEFINSNTFGPEITYCALGHIHKSQAIDKRLNIRYSGSPIPMSFSETRYQHKVLLIDLEGNEPLQITELKVPVTIPLLQIPEKPEPIEHVIEQLRCLPEKTANHCPYLEVKVLLNGPEPSLRQQIEQELESKAVRLAKISVSYNSSTSESTNLQSLEQLQAINPIKLLQDSYRMRYGQELPITLETMFHTAVNEMNHFDN
jgi:exonuclease SbcD